MGGRPAVDVLLWDCDGVLQHTHRDWWRYLDDIGGAGFARRVFAAELPALRGERPMREALTELLAAEAAERGGAPMSVPELLSIWEQFDVDEDAWALLEEVRALGVRCCLATNQHDQRAAFMRRDKGYDTRVDGAWYSCEVGARKPEPEFFACVLADLGIPLGDAERVRRVGFVDDVVANVEAAAALGISAVHHDPASGVAGLRADLSALVPGLSTT